MNTLNQKRNVLTISALAAHAAAHNIFNFLLNSNYSAVDINLVHHFLTQLVTEHYRIHIINDNLRTDK